MIDQHAQKHTQIKVPFISAFPLDEPLRNPVQDIHGTFTLAIDPQGELLGDIYSQFGFCCSELQRVFDKLGAVRIPSDCNACILPASPTNQRFHLIHAKAPDDFIGDSVTLYFELPDNLIYDFIGDNDSFQRS